MAAIYSYMHWYFYFEVFNNIPSLKALYYNKKQQNIIKNVFFTNYTYILHMYLMKKKVTVHFERPVMLIWNISANRLKKPLTSDIHFQTICNRIRQPILLLHLHKPP